MTRPRPWVDASVRIYHPDAAEISLKKSETPGIYWLFLSDALTYFSLGGPTADREADAKAMDRLAEVATEAAAKLRQPVFAEQPADGEA